MTMEVHVKIVQAIVPLVLLLLHVRLVIYQRHISLMVLLYAIHVQIWLQVVLLAQHIMSVLLVILEGMGMEHQPVQFVQLIVPRVLQLRPVKLVMSLPFILLMALLYAIHAQIWLLVVLLAHHIMFALFVILKGMGMEHQPVQLVPQTVLLVFQLLLARYAVHLQHILPMVLLYAIHAKI